MKKFSTSVNIERDQNKSLDYIVTANAKQAIGKIVNSFQAGIHSFCLIGSYGTGKSSFIIALEQCLSDKKSKSKQLIKNEGQFNGLSDFEFLNIVGDYSTLGSLLQDKLDISSEKNIFSALSKFYEKLETAKKCLVIVVDEFGKVLEHAAKNEPEKEMYFLQKFCEFVNDTSKNILFISTLHQSFNAYAKDLQLEQKQEWTKVKGRIQDIVFKEPVEQLLNLAASKISGQSDTCINTAESLYDLALLKKFVSPSLDKKVVASLYPMDVLAATILTLANQRYGQNERTLFTFLESQGEDSLSDFIVNGNRLYNIAIVHDYITYNFHTVLSEANQDSANWTAIRVAIERVEGLNLPTETINVAIALVKVIGLLNIFATSSASIDNQLLDTYGKLAMDIDNVKEVLRQLEQFKIVRFAKYKNRYILFEGTDINIEEGLYKASVECKRTEDIVDKLKSNFSFKLSLANAHYYETGTARFFEYSISSTPIIKINVGEIDGCVNLLFAPKDDYEAVKTQCLSQHDIPVIYCLFRNVAKVSDHIFEMDKLEYVRDYYIADEHDKVAMREIENLLNYEKTLLNREVYDSLYTNNVEWIFNGLIIEGISSAKYFTKFLSKVCSTVYSKTPIFKNELINKHKPSGTISFARQNYLQALLDNSEKEDLGFDKDKFPPEKAIYHTLLKNTGIHAIDGALYSLNPPTESSFKILWDACEDFLISAKTRQRKVGELYKILSEPPYGLKQGLIDCWVPSFLVIRKDDFALYTGNQYVPQINKEVLDLLFKNPNAFSIKTFDVTGVKQKFFDKYREAINLKETSLNTDSFIETIKPFLTFYRQLNDYAKTTKDITPNAIKFRDIISKATDPEETFFETLPEQLGFKEVVISQNPDAIDSFVSVLHDAIRDLRSCYGEYLKYVEKSLLEILSIDSTDYAEYKPIIDKRYKAVKSEYMPDDIKNFYSRLTSKFADKKTWLESVCFAILKKPLEKIKDSEKAYLRTAIQDKLYQLDDYVEMHKSSEEEIVRLHITQNNAQPKTKQIVIPKAKQKDVEKLANNIEELLSSDSSVNIAALIRLINKFDGK